ncbi:cobalamin B12-binding domain-containing protein [Azospirillum rugosum]|uniref:Methanogenic corrinoid protein MtbC1 n=1 Tax=Azospirillum rugosum TaxID=416170 RepID=A0ABS4SXE1_9PROT|nr:cobalamin-dependent protein [Azospirillum rugosum]MBP2296929.1 methanogenic corrinoid protein MtbC1 [Azospirillum rugosum]MDQ0530688.1 methanogenic corrinoid protein MtbC1 [Azospirillum rugosum]
MTTIEDREDAAERLEARSWWVIDATMTKLFRTRPIIPKALAEQVRASCTLDNTFHLAFLVNATAFDSPALFTGYTLWTRRVLASRGVQPADLAANLDCLTDAIAGLLPKPSAEAILPILAAARAALDDAPVLPDPDEPVGPDALDGLARRYFLSAMEGRTDQAIALVKRTFAQGLGLQEVCESIITPVQHEIGRLWELNRITVAEEHRCSAITQLAVAQLYPRIVTLRKQHRNGRSLVAASVGGDQHDLGLRLVCDRFGAAGWMTTYLGASVPMAGIVSMAAEARPDLLLLSVSMGMHLRSARTILRAIRAHPDTRDLPVLIGGQALAAAPGIADRLEGTAVAQDPASALDLANRLLP